MTLGGAGGRRRRWLPVLRGHGGVLALLALPSPGARLLIETNYNPFRGACADLNPRRSCG
jgi:hypothetical protein